jgi:hypothetical protein
VYRNNPVSIAAVLITFFSNGCLAAQNQLVGTWVWDSEKTLEEQEVPDNASAEVRDAADRARKLIQARTKNVGSKLTLEYTDTSCLQTQFDNGGNVLTRETIPYRVVSVTDKSITIDEFKNGGIVEIFMEGAYFYINVKVDDFTYKDYFRKL